MTMPDLTETMHRATEDLGPGSAEQLLAGAMAAGERRRRARSWTVGVAAAAVVGIVGAAATTAALTGSGGSATGRDVPVAASPKAPAAAPSSPTAYSPGGRTEVPGGPAIPTQRTIVDDQTLAQVTRDLVAHGALTGLRLTHVTGSGVGEHLADKTTDGRAMSFKVDGAGAWIVVGRWDGYHAVGFDDLGAAEGHGIEASGQKVALSAREACGGSYQVFPVIQCTQTSEGWYSMGRPNAGDAVAGAKELWVDHYTEDGWVVRVHTLNTAGEKQGPRIGAGTAINEADSLAIATSSRWFTAK